MSGRQGGKLKPLKVTMVLYGTNSQSLSCPPQTPKKDKKEVDEDDVALKAKKKAEAEALKAAKEKGS
jgi:hypothetical protein